MQVDRLGPDAETRQLLAQNGIRLPCIVKPRVACGTPEAHQMAVVLHEDGFKDLQVHLCLFNSLRAEILLLARQLYSVLMVLTIAPLKLCCLRLSFAFRHADPTCLLWCCGCAHCMTRSRSLDMPEALRHIVGLI